MDRWCLVISVSVNCLFPSLFEMFLAPNDIQILQRMAYPATTSEKCMVQVHIDLDWPTNSPIHDFKYSKIPGLRHQNDGKGKHTQKSRGSWLSGEVFRSERYPPRKPVSFSKERPKGPYVCWLKQRLVNGPVWGFWHRPWSRSLQFGGHSHEPTWKLMITMITLTTSLPIIATRFHINPASFKSSSDMLYSKTTTFRALSAKFHGTFPWSPSSLIPGQDRAIGPQQILAMLSGQAVSAVEPYGSCHKLLLYIIYIYTYILIYIYYTYIYILYIYIYTYTYIYIITYIYIYIYPKKSFTFPLNPYIIPIICCFIQRFP